MSGPVRWLLRIDGVSGDKQQGISQLQMTAEHGHFLAPFARIMLAIAYVREKNATRAKQILASLRDEFPGNPLFAREIAHLDAAH
jgi:predicted Zn-dependent protease